MNFPRPLKICAGILVGSVLFLALTALLIPSGELLGLVNRQLAREGYELQAKTFSLAFPVGLKGTGLELRSDKGAVLKADRLAVRLQLLPLLTGRVKVSLAAGIGSGSVNGVATLVKTRQLQLEASGVSLEEVPFFVSVTGAQVKGLLSLKGDVQSRAGATTGTLQLEVKGADLRGVKLGEMPLPDATYQTVQGMLRFTGNKASLESFSLQGESLFVRLKGDTPLMAPMAAAPLNLTLELMPKPDLLEKQKFVFLLLTKYLDSPGHYLIPVRGILGKPLIQ